MPERTVTTSHDLYDNSQQGIVIGVACSVAAVAAVIAGALWFTRKKWLAYLRRSKSGGEDSYSDKVFASDWKSLSTAGTGALPRNGCSGSNTLHTPSDLYRAEPEPDDRPSSLACSPLTAPYALTDMGVDGGGTRVSTQVRFYSLTNPDPQSATTDSSHGRQDSLCSRSDENNMGSMDGEEDIPSTSATSEEDVPSATAETDTDMVSPMTPETAHFDSRHTSPPSPMSPALRYTAYRPESIAYSAYKRHLPDKMLRNVVEPPPSLPQHYSIASHPLSKANARNRPSWAHISAQEAML
ncbi:hypothetical protein LTR37_002406 [Vermiconidia calcicola]|uniref:Uncharacterized protein n=1 Tax=Vermiconidia calcicola TaxID=1690605 RepID=A0ACC3NUE6_9PEZI|nr:hypothetical protein LTR37_002406 [Vermiconidia calcicola]